MKAATHDLCASIHLPDSALRQHIAILGKTGSGKTFTAKGIVEKLLAAGRRVCIIDPTGAWWGLRSSADGEKAGYEVVILGGAHGDAPLPALSGAACAELVVSGNVQVVFDTSAMTVGDRTRWFIDFGTALYRLNSQPLHLIIDEAHVFAPQGKVPDPETGKMLHAANSLASGGRSRGVRLMMLTQRPAKLHKDSLTCCDTLIAMRVIAPQDREAIEDWVLGCGDKAKGKQILDSLAQLSKGEGWVWFPEGGVLERVKFPRITTFDSSATPEDGSDFPAPKRRAEIDLASIQATMADAVKQAEDNDPKRLRRRIAELENALAAKGRDAEIMDDGRVAQLEAERAGTMRRIRELEHANAGFEDQRRLHIQALKTIRDYAVAAIDGTGMFAPMVPAPNHTHCKGTDGRADVRGPTETTRTVRTNRVERPAPSSASGLAGPLQKIIDAIAWWWQNAKQIQPSRAQVAGVAGYAVSGGSFARYLSSLSSMGLIRYPGDGLVELTDQGRIAARYQSEPDVLADLHGRVMEILDGPHRKILKVLLDAGGRELGRTEVAERAGYEASGGSFNRYVSHLSSLKLIRYPKRTTVAAATWLFPEGTR